MRLTKKEDVYIMTKVTIVRHGETELNRDRVIQGHIDEAINQRGIEQAKLAGYFFLKYKYNFTHCYSSPLVRATETAEYILKTIGKKIPVIPVQELTERDFGQFQGLQINEEYFYHIYEGKDGEYERNDSLQERNVKALTELCRKHDGEHLLVTAHAQTMKAILSAVSDEYNWHTILGNGSYCDLEFENGEFKITNLCTDTSDY